MRLLSSLLLVALGLLAWSAAPSDGRVTTRDAAATHTYLQARLRLQRAEVTANSSELEAIGGLAARISVECPGVLASAPTHPEEEQISESQQDVTTEVLFAVLGAGEPVEHPAEARFAGIVRRLRWSNPKLTRLLRSLADEQSEQSAIERPNLCADMRFWVASGYSASSPGTKRFVHRMQAVSSTTLIEPEGNESPVSGLFNLEALVARRLKPYEDRRDQLLAQRALAPSRTIHSQVVKPLAEAVARAYGALGLSRAPAA